MDNTLHLLIFLTLLHGGVGITCYYCDNADGGSYPYDPQCAMDGYDGRIQSRGPPYYSCCTKYYYDNIHVHHVVRGPAGSQEDGKCEDWGDHVLCYCREDKCNSGLCDWCLHSMNRTVQQIQNSENVQ
ncbi:unnamed protein product, partial [Meganyctiphanes norvegica]